MSKRFSHYRSNDDVSRDRSEKRARDSDWPGNDWISSRNSCESTFSHQHGMSLEDEAILRHKAAQFIFQLGAELNCPVYIVGKACVFMQRFYYRKSFGWPYRDIGAASLFLSWKVTEDPKFPLPRLKNFVRAFVKIAAKKTETPPEDSKEFGKWKDTLLIHEHSLLEGICFDLELDNPYERLLSLKEELSADAVILQTAWSMLNDTLKSSMWLRYSSNTIAAACIYMAYRLLGFKKPSHFDRIIDRPEKTLHAISEELLSLYERSLFPKDKIESPPNQLTPPLS